MFVPHEKLFLEKKSPHTLGGKHHVFYTFLGTQHIKKTKKNTFSVLFDNWTAYLKFSILLGLTITFNSICFVDKIYFYCNERQNLPIRFVKFFDGSFFYFSKILYFGNNDLLLL